MGVLSASSSDMRIQQNKAASIISLEAKDFSDSYRKEHAELHYTRSTATPFLT